MLENFLRLPAEKQNAVINAALAAFGANGYKKTSVSDIAAAAGISKAMVFHYFGTKKALYLYLTQILGRAFVREMNEKFSAGAKDFFDKILLAAKIEISYMKKHPAILSFLNSAYFETDAEVKADLQAVFTSEEGEAFRKKIVLDGMDASKFKDGVDSKLVMKMLTWMGYGYMNRFSLLTEANLDAAYREFEDGVLMLKNNLYKKEYLSSLRD